MNAGQEFEFFLDSFIDVYRNHADILRFNQFFIVYRIYELARSDIENSFKQQLLSNILRKKLFCCFRCPYRGMGEPVDE